MLHRYLNWRGYNTKVFNAGDFRRIVILVKIKCVIYRAVILESLHHFFDPKNANAMELRAKFAMMALDGM